MLLRIRTKQAACIAAAATQSATTSHTSARASATAASEDAAASGATTTVSVIGTPRSGGSDPLLQFYDDFDVSPKNYHTVLLDEAHLKHLVHKNVPPQNPPKLDPPNVPAPIYCAELEQFLASTRMEYPATHDPPPLRTTGVGNVLLDAQAAHVLAATKEQPTPAPPAAAAAPKAAISPTTAAEAAKKQAKDAAATKADATAAADADGGDDPLVEVLMSVEEEVTIEVEVDDEEATVEARKQADVEAETAKKAEADGSNIKRANVEGDKKFHCTLCGKPFRLKLAAQHHLTAKHPDGGAEIAEGPGLGEILSTSGGAAAAPARAGAAAVKTRKKKVKKTIKKLVERRMMKRLSEVDGVEGVKILKRNVKPTAAGAAASTTTDAAAGPKTTLEKVEKVRDPNRPPEVLLPSDEDVRVLLDDVWDMYGKQTLGLDKYKSLQDVVIATADKRKPVDPDAPVKEAATATPTYARKPEKKPQSTTAMRGDKIVNITVLSARFPNPFGDSASYMGDEEEDQASANPFLAANAIKKPKTEEEKQAIAAAAEAGEEKPKEEPPLVATPETSTLPMPSLHEAALKRSFQCGKCDSTFRLLDALQNHYNKKHGMEMPAEELRRAKLAKKRGTKFGVEPIAAKNAEDIAAKKKDGAADGSTSVDAKGVAAGEGSPQAPSPIPVSEVGVHMRSVSNIVIMGTVREVKEGFVKADPVAQLLLSVAAHDEGGGDSSSSSSAPAELVTVRIFGDQLKNIMRDAKTGAEVLIHGSLKLNRRIDPESKRSHSYPYVQVTFPHGSISVMEHSWGKSAAPTGAGAGAAANAQ